MHTLKTQVLSLRYVYFLTQKLWNLFKLIIMQWNSLIFYNFRSTNELNIYQYFCLVCGQNIYIVSFNIIGYYIVCMGALVYCIIVILLPKYLSIFINFHDYFYNYNNIWGKNVYFDAKLSLLFICAVQPCAMVCSNWQARRRPQTTRQTFSIDGSVDPVPGKLSFSW